MKSNRAREFASSTRYLVVILSLCITFPAAASGPGWYNNFEQAVQAARQQGRPIFVDFSTSWCAVCKQMDRTTLADPAIISRLDNFVKVKVDADARQDLCSVYGVDSYPTFMHLDSNGRVIEKRAGFMRPQEMASALDKTWVSVSTSLATAKANRQQNSTRQQSVAEAPTRQIPQIASADLKLLPAGNSPTAGRGIRDVSKKIVETSDNSSDGSLYNMSAAQLQGSSVYAMGAGPSSSRRSRFASSVTEQSDLKELAEATANPPAEEEDSNEQASAKEDSDENDDDKESSSPTEKSEKIDTKIAAKAEVDTTEDNDKKSEKNTDEKAANADEKSAEKETKNSTTEKETVETEKRETAQPAVVLASADASPVIESRLAGLAEVQLPKPLLSRTISDKTEAMSPAPTVSSQKSTKDPLATIRRIQKDDTGSPTTPVSSEPIAVAPAKTTEKNAPEITPDEKPSREIASATPKKSETKKADTKDSSEKDKPKTSEGATRDDIERWMDDADSKLVEAHKTQNTQRKREARAMYNKVVDKDPDNKFGKSDMAYVKGVSLMVDKDSDLLRRQAYNKIKEFEARFPKSDHKDYYTLIRAILATDLGETNEAHKLLGTYAERFPDSKYRKVAHDTWKSLPDVKKESGDSKSSADSGKSKSRRSDS